MIVLRGSSERRHVLHGGNEAWFTFYPDENSELHTESFGSLMAFDETRLAPRGSFIRRHRKEAELVTFIYRGALAQEVLECASGVFYAGEFQYMVVGEKIDIKETNASQTDWTHIFRISLSPLVADLEYSLQNKRFAAGQRRNALCVIASPDGRKGSLPILQDTLICSCVLGSGHHLVHELLPGRSAWLHVISGEAVFTDFILVDGDSVGVTEENSLSISALQNTEILLVDLGPGLGP